MGVNQEILKELKLVLEQGTNKDKDSISVYNVINLVRNKYNKCKSLDRKLNNRISDLITDSNLNIYYGAKIYYDAKRRYLIIMVQGYYMYFTKQYDDLNNDLNGDLILDGFDYYKAKKILAKYGQEISERYDMFIKDISFYRDYMNNVHSTNSNFIINSDENSINVKYNDYFMLSAQFDKDEYECDCYSNNVISICRDKEDEIFKRIFVKINDCPEWTRETLYAIRKKQLEEQEKLEYKEMKKQKRLELTRKFFPFLKK